MRPFSLRPDEPRGQELITRYRARYAIPPDAPLTEAMVLRHWNLERDLTQELLASTPANRREVFERCYSTLYTELGWLRELTNPQLGSSPQDVYGDWRYWVGPPPSDVYEVGSGTGALLRYLASLGHVCRGSDISPEADHPPADGRLSWGQTDGVHLDDFEAAGSYDAVISNQVVEHLHPDDVRTHFASAARLLRPGGRYVVATPHAHLGPTDVSSVFRTERPQGMHLREYTYAEIGARMRAAGFGSLAAPIRMPTVAGRRRPPRPSRAYFAYLCGVERLLGLVPYQLVRRTVARRLFVEPLSAIDVTVIGIRR